MLPSILLLSRPTGHFKASLICRTTVGAVFLGATMDNKECYTCKAVKPLREFGRQQSTADWLSPYCRDCAREYKRRWRAKNKERCSLYGKRWREKNPARKRMYNKLDRDRAGIKPAPKYGCYFCKEDDTVEHHPNYSAPKLTISLCRRCHLQYHALRNMEADGA